MRLHNLPSEFQEALPILEKIKQAGFEAYFVGGSVRDALLGRPIHDVDIASSSYPEETKAIFPRTIDVGIEHGTVLVLEEQGEYEITTFRTEDVYVDYRRPSQVSFVRSLEEDLKRRDFTVNAFALDDQAQIIDKFDGLRDLENKTLRAVGRATERFTEDALRIMRGFRFAASLDFTIEDKTFEAMKETALLLEKISVERIFIEFDKLLLAKSWRKGMEALIASKAYNYLPDMKETATQLTAFLNSLSADFTFRTSEQAWAMLIIYLDIAVVKSFLTHWKTSNEFQRTVMKLVEIYQLRKQGPVTKQICYRYGKDLLYLVEELRQAQGLAVAYDQIDAIDQSLTIRDKHEIVVKGGDVLMTFQLKPGPILGQLLNEVELAIVEGDLANEVAPIMAFLREKIDNE
ncbi:MULTISPECIES: CCA tRNA nucleotidyltransferase [unclassified Streptococcus]|uniref:CCA tRNA nucleotidyltransferase n=1 Tax=unclassified Streptococcus TaxID=2608887 RepID=UPI0010729C80|nr:MULTISPECIES: CCA tRNA nucleotidyltransferase [unclassified Streptococcus]MBF0787783.1 CCA tRNA nucleotidyltransferase [Streptococcus sp. 19428wC2_LYSM12]MCQ9212757.1 CCA tRNA nucleotidyltransferase [Streptococcus sp. B01]MCQ9214098.1 CCA tRNA nucleotidyltransferase [Streptococcus sp. O1]TFV05215.1 CCA tRNA nucleotidyltransferase [Streptococcus sp. LYSM12]